MNFKTGKICSYLLYRFTCIDYISKQYADIIISTQFSDYYADTYFIRSSSSTCNSLKLHFYR